MPAKDPTTYSLLTYCWVFGVSSLGGVVSYINKIKQGKTKVFSFWGLVGEAVTSVFAGITTFFLCESAGLEQITSAALIGLSGHMGSRAIYLIQHFTAKKIGVTESEFEQFEGGKHE